MLLMENSTISMAIFNSFLYVYQRVYPSYILINPIESHWITIESPLNPIKSH